MILTPLPRDGEVHPVPFQEVAGYFSVPPEEAVVQVVGNLAVFAAFGALAPLRWRLGSRPGPVSDPVRPGTFTSCTTIGYEGKNATDDWWPSSKASTWRCE